MDEKQTAESSESKEEGKEEFEEYEVEIVQPYGLKFVKGRDGGTYIDAIAPGGFADQTKMFTVGDKVIATRFVFFSNLYNAYAMCVCLYSTLMFLFEIKSLLYMLCYVCVSLNPPLMLPVKD